MLFLDCALPLALFLVPLMVFILPCICGLWFLFAKAGVPGWQSIIPVYNLVMLLKIVGKSVTWVAPLTAWFIFLLVLILRNKGGDDGYWAVYKMLCILNFAYSIWMLNMLSKSFGKNEAFTVGLVLMPYIFLPILGIGHSRYRGPYGNKRAYRKKQASRFGDFDFGKNIPDQ